MPGQVTRAAKHHAPRHVRHPAPQLAIDEVAEPAGRESERNQRRKEVHEPQIVDALAPGGESHGSHDPEQAAMKRHAALPYREDLERMRQVMARLVEEHIPEPASED